VNGVVKVINASKVVPLLGVFVVLFNGRNLGHNVGDTLIDLHGCLVLLVIKVYKVFNDFDCLTHYGFLRQYATNPAKRCGDEWFAFFGLCNYLDFAAAC
jgi:hypothetical protein